ncbi:MAG: HindVP family restriction endonuclease [Turicibacter sp.]|nr:HindVP family restriction endonuclease [Turicibacter sp.]
MEQDIPKLFGINKSNRDFSQSEAWGKNQFNSSFPVALACYLFSKNMPAIYITADKNVQPEISPKNFAEIFNTNPLGDNVYFSFETAYIPFQKYLVGAVPRNDVTVIDTNNDKCLSSCEIKLTALPDNSTCMLDETKYGVEIVVRPDTITYLACSFIDLYKGDKTALKQFTADITAKITNWTQPENVLPYINDICSAIYKIVADKNERQSPIILNPVWKTLGKSANLAENCLDVFAWSNFGILNLFMPSQTAKINEISRHTRAAIWLFKMLADFSDNGKFNAKKIIDELSYNTKNDKAFATNGVKTNATMACNELTNPRIKKGEIKNIILGGGQNLLSPERRFDAVIYNSPALFDEGLL